MPVVLNQPASTSSQKSVVLARLQLTRPGQPPRIAVGLKELEHSPDQAGVVLGVGVDRRLAVAKSSQQASCRIAPEVRPDEIRRLPRGVEPDPRIRTVTQDARARANAAIISPFHEVMTLSSRCGRGRVPRASNNVWRARPSVSTIMLGGLARAHRDVFDRLRRVEQVLAGELSLRILGRIAARLDAEALPHDIRVVTQERADLLVATRRRRPLRACDRPPGTRLSASSAE